MKKIVGTIAAIALATSAAFAEVNVGMGFNRAIFAPFTYGTGAGDKVGMTTCVSWGGAPRVGVSFSAAGEQIGVVGDIKLDGNSVAVNDNAYIWVKPVSWFKMQIGQSFDDTLRGGMGYGLWDWLRCWGVMAGDDLTFTRISGDAARGFGGDVSTSLAGAILMLDPVEGLHIGVGFKTSIEGNVVNDNDADGNFTGKYFKYGYSSAEKVFKNLQVQAGYTIANIAQIKAQWIGYEKANGDAAGIINAAVGLKAVEDMTLEVGAFFKTEEKSNIVISAMWAMPISSVKLNALAKVVIPGSDAEKLDLTAGVGAGFDLGNGMNLSADVRFHQKFADGAKTDLAFGVFFDKWLGNGSLGIGFEGALNGASIAGVTAAGDFKMALPIRVQCFF
ncbi:hypothetical protein [Treponema sp.]|uniref:hypothetical protein n=1 Tax=Treponema sp. TaxID=166 RepID=UPI00298E2082|nr:hypothetical protein [Treponema sp.]MCR5613802.1 hypothetical protein [Treponema sp.]